MYAFAIDGTPIRGTLENTPGMARIAEDSFAQGEDGLTFDNSGGTEHFYNDQETVIKDGQTIYVDEDGDEWPENKVVLHEVSNISSEEIRYLRQRKGPVTVLGNDLMVTDRILYEIANIDWDTSGDDEAGEPDLPTSIVVSIDPEEEDFDFADALSDRYDFCVNGFSAQRLELEAA